MYDGHTALVSVSYIAFLIYPPIKLYVLYVYVSIDIYIYIYNVYFYYIYYI